MKNFRLLFWIIIGGIAVCIILVIFSLAGPDKKTVAGNNATTGPGSWNWPPGLDAMIAAPGFHKLLFESDEMRIMEVTINPGMIDPIHTHRGKSIVWIVKSSPIVYVTYQSGKGNSFIPVKKDTIYYRPDELNKANWEMPEPPHSVENIGTDTFRLYRIEYKNRN